MTLLTPLLSLLLINPTTSIPSLEHRASPKCHDFTIPITASTTHNKKIYSPTHNLSTVDGVTSFLSSTLGLFGQQFEDIPQSGTFPLSARYCHPSSSSKTPKSRAKHVQLLMHGIPYTKNYWNGNDYPKGDYVYDWIAHMTSMGFPTLSFDNLGNGNSSYHPDPILTVQQPLETEVVHQLTLKLREGKIGHGVPKAEKVIYVGHSYASVLGNAVMTKHPKDFDAAILTGYTYTIANAVPGVLLAALAPAQLYSVEKYGNLAPGYLTFDLRFGKRESYYAGKNQFDHSVANFDFDNQGITTIGEIGTFFSGLQKAEKYTGDVMAITGENDALFCGLGSRAIEIPHCGKGSDSVVARSGRFFPNANYKYYMPPGTSHATNLHHTSQSIFKQAYSFLDSNGY